MAGKRIVAILLAFLLAATSVNMQSVTAQANEGEDIIVFDEDSFVTQDAESEILDDESGSAIKTTDTVTGYEELEAQLKAIEEGSSDVEVLSEEEYLIESFEILLSGSDSNVANPEDYDVLTYDNWQYYLDEDNYAHLVGYTDNSVSELEVPARFGKYIVVSIEKGAFSGLESLASIAIPFYVTNIDEKAFETPVSIKAYNGAYALSYAAYYGYTYENLSSLDFANGVYDFSQIIRSHYSFRTNLDIEMDEAEARLLDVDSVFFLPESEELPNGDAFKVISITDEGEHKLIHCERAIGAEALDRLSFEDYDLKPDWENAIYYFDFDNDGNYESVPADELEWENGKAELISPLTDVVIDIDDDHLIISIDEKKTKSGEPYSTDIGDYVKFNVAIEDTISVNAVADIDLSIFVFVNIFFIVASKSNSLIISNISNLLFVIFRL